MENIYDLTNFNLKKDPLLTFIVKTVNNETVIKCNDNIIGTYNQIVSEHDITDIINQLLYEKNIDIKNLCFIVGNNSNYISIKTDNKTYDNINRNTVVKKFKTISLDFTGYSNMYCILKCFMINYKLDDMANYMNHDKINSKYAHIVSPVYDEEDDIMNDNINVTLYFDLQNGSYNNHILYKLVDVKEKFIKNIKFTSTDNKYIILCKLFEIHKDAYYRLYVCKIYNIDLDKSVNVCFFNNMNKFINSNGTIKIKEYDKYINILDNRIFIDLTEYKYYMHKSYINYTVDSNIDIEDN